MNNLPLQPLVWIENTIDDYIDHRAQGAGVSYRVCYFADKFRVYWVDSMGGSDGNKEFNSLDELKHWVDTDHYPHKMQPYVKPMPTWIDVNERLPERKELLTDKDKCLVLTECGKVWTGFYNMHIKPDGWYLHGWAEKQGWHPFKIVAWMLASEFSTMQNLHKGE